MHTILFEDGQVGGLGPLVAARPACDLSIGSTTLFECLGGFGEVTRVTRAHLARHLDRLAGRRIPLWGSSVPAVTEPHVASTHGAILLVANARLVPGRSTLAAIRRLVEAGHEGAVRDGDDVLAAIVKVHDPVAGTAEIVRRLADASDAAAVVAELAPRDLDPDGGGLRCLTLPHSLLDAHEREFEANLASRIDTGRYRKLRDGLYVADGAEIEEPVAVRGGPVVVETAARVGPFVVLDGPAWIGAGTRVNPHAWLRQGTAAGRDCRLGGEVESSVLEAFSNKPHDGFLGHSHVGSWVNLAAGTITSNLKASYGPVRMRPFGRAETIDTGRQFVGAFVGDMVRTAIHTSIQCGSQIGPAATITGTVAGTVPAFSTMLHEGSKASTCGQAAASLERMMARRGIAFCEADLGLLEDLAGGRSGL